MQERGEPFSHLVYARKELTLENPSYFQKQAEHFMDGQIKGEQSTTTENLIRAKQEGENII